MRPRATRVALLAVGLCARPAEAQRNERCNAPSPAPVTHVAVPGNPFQALPSADGCWIFASLAKGESTSPGIGVIERRDGALTLRRVAPAPSAPAGMVLTHDGTLLIATAGDAILFYDVPKLISGEGVALLGTQQGDVPEAGRVYANVTDDDRYLFVSDERAKGITVVDLAATRSARFAKVAIIGRIPVGRSPIALTFSRDGKWLYTTSQVAPDEGSRPLACRPQSATAPTAAPDHARGAIVVIDVAKAVTTPEKAVTTVIEAGCNPVRLHLTAAGDALYVTARGQNEVLVFDPRRFASDAAHALVATVPVGTAPVGIAGVDGDRRIVVTNSNRFAGTAADLQALSVLDASAVAKGAAAVIGEIPAGAFPRELRLTADGRTLIATNYNSRTVQVIDVARALATLRSR